MYVYQGHGVSLNSFAEICDFFTPVLKLLHPKVDYLMLPLTLDGTRSNEHWHDPSSTAFFIIPGGRDEPFVRDIAGEHLENLKTYLATGGVYIGICAGAYVATSFIRFEEGHKPYEVIGPRWNLAPCMAMGSLFQGTFRFNYSMMGDDGNSTRLEKDSNGDMMSQSCAVNAVRIHADRGFLAHYNGGPYFTNLDASCCIHAWYDILGTKLPAAISSKYGLGSVFLLGFHIENKEPAIDLNSRMAFCLSMLLH